LNSRLFSPDKAIAEGLSCYAGSAKEITEINGTIVDRGQCFFNLWRSNTELVVLFNVESRSDRRLMLEKTQAILQPYM